MKKIWLIQLLICLLFLQINTAFCEVIYSPGTDAQSKKGPDADATFYNMPAGSSGIDANAAEIISQIVVVNPTISNVEINSPSYTATKVSGPDSNISESQANTTSDGLNVVPSADDANKELKLQNLTIKTLTSSIAANTSSPTYALINATKRHIYATKDQDKKYNPSGLTNLMTAYIATKYLTMDAELTVKSSALRNIDKDASIAALSAGDKIKLRDAIASMFVKGCVDSANVVAETISGNITDFVALMNKTSEELGLTNTHFVDPSGISNDNTTTAIEMAVIMGKVCENPQLVELLSLYQYVLPATATREKLIIYGRNTQLNKDASSYNADIKASRLAYTSNSKFCIASMMEHSGNQIIAVVLKAEGTQFSDTKKILEFGKQAASEDQ